MAETIDIQTVADGLILAVKAVPGASHDRIAGRVGHRLKIRVAASPEAGKANERIIAVLAGALGLARRDVTIHSGRHHTQKSIHIRTTSPQRVVAAIEQLAN